MAQSIRDDVNELPFDAPSLPPLNRQGLPLKVVFITITFDPEPGALRGLPLARWLAARGFDVRVLTGFPQYPLGRLYDGYRTRLWAREVMDGIPVLRVPIYPSHDTSPLRRIWTYLSFMLTASLIGVPLIGDADVVFLYEPPPTNGVASTLLKLIRGAPVVHHIADMWPETVLASGMLPKPLHAIADQVLGAYCRFLYGQAAIMSVLSPGFKRMLEKRGVPPRKIMVSYNWADEESFRPLARNEELAAELGLAGRFNIVYAGNIGPLQGLDTVVRAAALVRDTDPRVQIVIIGTGPAEAEVRALAADIAATNVLFLRRREYWEMPLINALADVLLVHLRDYGFLASTIPSKVQVSLSSGRPVLLAVRGDAADLLMAAGAGLTCPPDDVEALADRMLGMAALPVEELDAMGRSGRAFYLRNLSLDVAGAQMDEALRRAYRGDANAPASASLVAPADSHSPGQIPSGAFPA